MSAPTSDRPERPDRPFAVLPAWLNVELIVYVLASVAAAVAVWAGDAVGAGSWLDYFGLATAAYLLSRGIAKASRVFEY